MHMNKNKLYVLIVLAICLIITVICTYFFIKRGHYSIFITLSIPFIILIIDYFLGRKDDKDK